MNTNNKINLKSFSKNELIRFFADHGLPRYRAGQLINWIYKKYASEIDEITEFSMEMRESLKQIAYISNLKPVSRQQSSDGTEKFLFSIEDGQTIESVLIPEKDRLTLCISSQVGCAMGCRFCLTGKLGLFRNLKACEIFDQIVAVNRLIKPGKVTNVVLMGMGEPLANFDEVVEALWRIVELIGISKRRVTLSTAGIVPEMLLLPERAPAINLAVSLNAATDEARNDLMPINRKYPIRMLIEACRKYPLQRGRRITFEYVMIEGKNDSPEDARRLVKLLKGIHCKVNLIPLNPYPGSDFKRPLNEKVLTCQKILMENKIRTLIRESRGQDILAACGQLRAGYAAKGVI